MGIAPYAGGKSRPGAAKLSSNETPLGASPKALEAFAKSAATLHRYPDGMHTRLREAIGNVYDIPPQRIVCGAGSDELIGLLVHAYAGAGDEVLYSEHGFLMYKIYAQSFGATPVGGAPEKPAQPMSMRCLRPSRRARKSSSSPTPTTPPAAIFLPRN